jgi:hypothetical protein
VRAERRLKAQTLGGRPDRVVVAKSLSALAATADRDQFGVARPSNEVPDPARDFG